MAYLAAREGGVALCREVAADEGIPLKFLAQIMRDMGKAGLVEGTRGAQGGFRLAKPAGDISVLDIVEAAEGPVSVFPCVTKDSYCPRRKVCPLCGVWVDAQRQMAEVLSSARLDDLTGQGSFLASAARSTAAGG